MKSGRDHFGLYILDEHYTSLSLNFLLPKWEFKTPFPKCQWECNRKYIWNASIIEPGIGQMLSKYFTDFNTAFSFWSHHFHWDSDLWSWVLEFCTEIQAGYIFVATIKLQTRHSLKLMKKFTLGDFFHVSLFICTLCGLCGISYLLCFFV